MIGALPQSVLVGGKEYEICTDFRDVLKILSAINDPELTELEKVYVCLVTFYPDFADIPEENLEEAYKAAVDFIDYGSRADSKHPSPRLVDWDQDERLIMPAVNKVAGMEVRDTEYLHWWTFLGYYMEMSDGVFAQVLTLRAKKARREKLEKHEQRFWASNKDICVIRPRLSKEEQEAKDRLNALLN